MNRKKNKRKNNDHAGEDLKSNIKNVNPDVLVLPPNLLQKLGIHLGNIKGSQNNSNADLNTEIWDDLKTVNDQSNNQAGANSQEEKNLKNCEIQSSIIETANLMKESVLLSPTFNILQSNTVLCEENVLQNSEVSIENSTGTILECDNLVLRNNDNMSESFEYLCDHTEKESSVVRRNSDVDSKNIKVNCIETKNKINIISEEVIDPETLNKLKLLPSPKTKILFPVTIDTIISTNKSANTSQTLNINCDVISNNDHETICVHSIETSQDRNKTQNIEINEVSDVCSDSKMSELSETILNIENKISVNKNNNTKEKSDFPSQISDENVKKQLTANNIIYKPRMYSIDGDLNELQSTHEIILFEPKDEITSIDSNDIKQVPESIRDNVNLNVPFDKVKETTKNLSQHLNIENVVVHNKNNNKVKLKACVQGVEKPGGIGENKNLQDVKQNIKTYLRGNKPKWAKNKLLENYFHGSEIGEIDAKSIDYLEVQHDQEFCICWDFGILDKNGLEENYEHIHFTKKEAVQISPKILFSIYDEDKVFERIEEEVQEETTDTCNKICWDSVRYVTNSEVGTNTSSDISQNMILATSSNHCSVSDVEGSAHTSTYAGSHNANNSKVLNDNLNIISITKIEDNKNESSKPNLAIIITSQSESGNNDHLKKCGKLQQQKQNNDVAKKRKIAGSDMIKQQKESDGVNPLSSKRSTETIDCGVCKKQYSETEWGSHISKEHSLMSWKEGDAVCTEYDVEMKESLDEITTSEASRTSEALQSSIIAPFESTTDDVTDSMLKVDSIDENQSVDNVETAQLEKSMLVKCGVCQLEVEKSQWISHIAQEHNYLAWRHGQPQLDFNDIGVVHQHLYRISKKKGGLHCFKCGRRRKYVKSYLQHVEKCDGDMSNDKMNETTDNSTLSDLDKTLEVSDSQVELKTEMEMEIDQITCGVCQHQMACEQWLKHAQRKHGYLAWKEGAVPLDVTSKDVIYQHLKQICKTNGELTCNRCSTSASNATSYLEHIEKCSKAEHRPKIFVEVSVKQEGMEELGGIIKCAVCSQEMLDSEWMNHIAREHNYLAWKEGEPPMNLDDNEFVHQHLYQITKEMGGLICSKCGRRRKYVKSYMQHIKICNGRESCGSKNNGNESYLSDLNSTLEVSQFDVTDDEDSTCGVCRQPVKKGQWWEHAQREHGYLAWREGQTPLDVSNEDAVFEYLHAICKQNKELVCNKCDTTHLYVKNYLRHLRKCTASKQTDLTVFEPEVSLDINKETRQVKCGVCLQEVCSSQWLDHIIKEHNYLAWEHGTPKLNLSDEKEIFEYLNNISKKHKGLLCSKCGLRRKYVKPYLQHVSSCDGIVNDSVVEPVLAKNDLFEEETDNTTCGVCRQHVAKGQWWEHAQREHGYLAWREGQTPLNLDDEEAVNQHLYIILKKLNGLTCSKCGLTRKYVKAYLTHVKMCVATTSSIAYAPKDKGTYVCGVCAEEGSADEWKSHSMSKHYNVAWVVGDYPIDIKNPFAVEKYLKEYKQHYNKLACTSCGLERVSYAGFYAHIIQCGKKEEEIEVYKSFCDICNSKYLCIYKNQHISMHREQENARQRKLISTEKKNTKDDSEEIHPGRRRAAEKAKNVIQKYNSDLKQFAHKCPNCDYGADDENDLEHHICDISSIDSMSDCESSDSIESSSSGEDSESSACEIESEPADEKVAVERKRKKHYESNTAATRVPRIPFVVKNAKSFLEQSAKDFCKIHLTTDTLFPHWRYCKYESIPENELSKYMPLLKESCKIAIHNDEWTTLKLFESKKEHGFSMFVGASVQSIAWVPGHVGVGAGAGVGWLAVASHRGGDCPRLSADRTYSGSGMLQIWEFGELFRSTPKFVLGIAHNYGTVWAMDWCPSGAQDVLHKDLSSGFCRLGLMAAACSNGSACIFSVPYPSTIANSKELVYNLTPVAELRLSRGERESYQATSISWSTVKGHSIIVVGYADGSIAFYNINCDSPLLTDRESKTTIFYPYHDEKVHSTCITDVNILANSASVAAGVGVVSSAAPTGALLAVHGAELRAHLHTTHAAFPPHWPSVLLTGNDAIVNQAVNEMDCWGVGRRVGSVQCWCGCLHCGAAVVYSPSVLRLMQPHPAHSDLYGVDVATIQMKVIESKKGKKPKTDTLAAAQTEPMSYEEVVKVYGIKFKLIKDGKVNPALLNKLRELCPERFPLADVPAMAFCPSAAHHRYLAVATHAGVIFVFKDHKAGNKLWNNDLMTLETHPIRHVLPNVSKHVTKILTRITK